MAGGMIGPGNGRRRYRPLAEINVTPLVDVMLVLLIVFMVAAPLMTSGISVDLPKAASSPVSQDKQPITVSIRSSGDIYLGDSQVDLASLGAQLKDEARKDPDRRILVRGDKSVAYDHVMEVTGIISSSGFPKMSLLTDQPGGAQPAATGRPAPTAGGRSPGR